MENNEAINSRIEINEHAASKYVLNDEQEEEEEEVTDNFNHSFYIGQNRNLIFNYNAFFRYYFVDFFSMTLGPLLIIPIAIIVMGLPGAKNMLYLPVSIQGWVIKLLIEHIFWLMNVVPLIEGILVLTGQRPTSNFDPIGEGLIIFICSLFAPLASAAKYGYMTKLKFETEILGSAENAVQPSINGSVDETKEAIGPWLAPLKDKLIGVEVKKALWRTGDPLDGKNFKLKLVDKDSNEDQSPLKRKIHNDGNEYNLEQVLISIVKRNNGKGIFQLQFTKYHFFSFLFIMGLMGSINPLYKNFVLNVPAFGSDWFEITASSLMVLGIGFGFVGFSLFRPLNGASGHLARSRKIIHDYNNLLLPPLYNNENLAMSNRMVNENNKSTKNDVVEVEKDAIGLINDKVPPIILTPDQIKIWARGRSALLMLGEIYWLRLSILVGSVFFEFFVFILFLLVQLILALLSNDGKMEISAFIVFISISIVLFVAFFGIVVLEGIRITYVNKRFRTKLLQRARHVSLLKIDHSEAVALELRNLAFEIDSELQSNPIRLLGLKLNLTMLESLIGGIGVVILGIYQTFTT